MTTYEISITCKAKTKIDKITFWSIFSDIIQIVTNLKVLSF